MKFNYSEFCYSDRYSLNNKTLNTEEEIVDANKLLFDKLNNTVNAKTIFKVFLESFGEWEEVEEPCEQCGSWDTIINLEL